MPGRLKIRQTDNVHGSVTGYLAPNTGTGTYPINEDCSGTGTVVTAGAPPLELRFLVVKNGKEVQVIVTPPKEIMVSGIGKKL